MSNELPDNRTNLLDLAEDMIDGLLDHGDNVGIKQWTAASVTAVLDASKTRKTAHEAAGTAEDGLITARKVANSNAKGFIATARRMLVDDLGSTPNKAWENVGWPSGSTAAPDTIDGRKKILDKLVPWLEANPAKEIPQRQFTGAKGRTILTALDTAMGGLPAAVGNRVKAAAASLAADKALRNGMSGLAAELDSILSDDSPDWYYFGLVPPANPTPPAPPEHLSAHQAGPTTVVAGCDRSPRGQKYIFLVQIVGRDASPIAQEPLREPQITLENLPMGATVKISAYATNAAGKSAVTSSIQIALI